jgi:hypothetical protein
MPAFLMPLLVNRYTIGAVIGLGLLLGAYWKGHSTAAQNCRDAELRAQIATMQRDMAAWRAADDIEKLLQSELETQRNDLQDRVKQYEIELAQRPNGKCALDDRDIRNLDRMHGIGKR